MVEILLFFRCCIMSRFAPLVLVSVLIGSGCNQTSPVVEYSAAVQALHLNYDLLEETSKAAESTQDPELRKDLLKNAESLEDQNARLKARIKVLAKQL